MAEAQRSEDLQVKRTEKYLKSQHTDLPADWEVYAFECLPKGAYEFTHVEVTGGVPRLLKAGKRKGQKTWRDGVEERTFILSFDEIDEWENGQLALFREAGE
jgi:hypothetical protein